MNSLYQSAMLPTYVLLSHHLFSGWVSVGIPGGTPLYVRVLQSVVSSPMLPTRILYDRLANPLRLSRGLCGILWLPQAKDLTRPYLLHYSVTLHTALE